MSFVNRIFASRKRLFSSKIFSFLILSQSVVHFHFLRFHFHLFTHYFILFYTVSRAERRENVFPPHWRINNRPNEPVGKCKQSDKYSRFTRLLNFHCSRHTNCKHFLLILLRDEKYEINYDMLAEREREVWELIDKVRDISLWLKFNHVDWVHQKYFYYYIRV